MWSTDIIGCWLCCNIIIICYGKRIQDKKISSMKVRQWDIRLLNETLRGHGSMRRLDENAG